MEPLAQRACLHRLHLAAASRTDRTVAGQPVRPKRTRADRADLPAVALHRRGRRTDRHRGALSRRGAHPRLVREFRHRATHQPRPEGRCRHAVAALRRASARIGDRHRLVAARFVVAAAQADRLHQGGAEAARRCQCGNSVQPRDPADRARPRAPGHRRVRPRPATDLLEPAIRRRARSAAGPHPRRRAARRDPALQRGARHVGARRDRETRAYAAGTLHRGGRRLYRAVRRARIIHRSTRQSHAGRCHRHHLHRHDAERRGGRGAGESQRDAGAARARTHRGTDAAERGAGARQA